MGVFIDGKILGYSFRPPKKYKPKKQAFWCSRNLLGIVRNSGLLDYSELSIFLLKAVKGEYFAKALEKGNLLSKFLDKAVESLEDHVCPKIQGLVDEEICISSRDPFRHKTTFHCAEREAKLFGNWIMRHSML